MEYMSTSDLRRKTSKLRDALKKGNDVHIMYRSKVIGILKPYFDKEVTATLEKLNNFIQNFPVKNPKSYKERKKEYLKHLEQKYGKDLS